MVQVAHIVVQIVLKIETNVLSQGSPLEQKLNYDKGDYEALRSYVNCNWNKEFATADWGAKVQLGQRYL